MIRCSPNPENVDVLWRLPESACDGILGGLKHGPFLWSYQANVAMLIGSDLSRLSTRSLTQIQQITRQSVKTAVRTSCENLWIRGMVDQLRECEDPVDKVLELSDVDPDCLRALLLTALFVFEQQYAIQRHEEEIERRAALN